MLEINVYDALSIDEKPLDQNELSKFMKSPQGNIVARGICFFS